MSQSVHLATLVQKEFKQTARRTDRGVHQAGFLVLKASAMPSILVELGFISTPEEERYLNTDSGRNTLARSIYRAFITYKKEQEVRTGSASAPADSTRPVPTARPHSTPATSSSAPLFKVQILASTRPIPQGSKEFKGLKDVAYYREKGMYKYTSGSSTDYNEILRLKRELASQFKGAFVIAFKNGKKMDVEDAIREYEKNNK